MTTTPKDKGDGSGANGGDGPVRSLDTRRDKWTKDHVAHLRASGLDDKTLAMTAGHSERTAKGIAAILKLKAWRPGGHAIAFDYIDPRTNKAVFQRVRPDNPRKKKNSKGEAKPRKYEQPYEVPLFPYFTPRSTAGNFYEDPGATLVFTEGEKKALLLDQLGWATIGAAGVFCFHDVAFRNTEERWKLHEAILACATIKGRKCVIVFDSDHEENDQVMHAARVLCAMLLDAGAASVLFCKIPGGPNGEKYGIDDYYVANGIGADGKAAVEEVIRTAVEIEPAALEDTAPTLASWRALRGADIGPKLRTPYGYEIDRKGALIEIPADPEAEIVRVESRVILIKRLLDDLDDGMRRAELAFKDRDDWRSVIANWEDLVDARKIVAALSPYGAPVDSSSAKGVVKWLRALHEKNERRLSYTPCVTRCGWREVDGRPVFVAGDVIERPGKPSGVVFDARGGRERFVSALRTEGDEDRQREALCAAFEADRVAATVIMGALAAPLLKPLSADLFAIHLPGDSSKGKSSMLKIAASIYGNPRSEEWVPSWNSTAVGLEMRAHALCDLPLCIDEAGVIDAARRQAAVYMLINGTGRTRGARTGGLRATTAWRTVLLSTGEQPLADDRAATGAQARILQFPVHGFGDLDARGVDEIRGACEENYGMIGRSWLEALVAVEDWEPYRAELKRRVRAIQADVEGGGVRARQAAFIGVLAFTEWMSSQTLGIGSEDGGTMRQWLTDDGGQTMVAPAADRALELVQAWRRSQARGFIELVPNASGRIETRGGETVNEILGFVGTEAVLFIPYQLRAFLDKHNLSADVVTGEWKRRGWLVQTEAESVERSTHRVRIDGGRQHVVAVRAEIFGEGCGNEFTD